MKSIRMLLAVLVAGTSAIATMSIGDFGSAQAKAHEKKGKPGSCGTLYYYDKKKRLCVNATFK